MLHIILASKNRACQCDATLRSLKEQISFPFEVNILYTTTNSNFENAYKILLDKHSSESVPIRLHRETAFKSNIINLIQTNPCQNIMFLTDEEIIRRPWHYDDTFKRFETDDRILSLVIRVGHELKYRDNENKCIHPKIWEEKNIWDFRIQTAYHWQCIMAFGSQVYKRQDLIDYLPTLKIVNPNSMEALMCQYIHFLKHRSLLICYDQSKVVAFNLNEVRGNGNPGSVSTEYLNTKFLNGLQLKLNPFYSVREDTSYFENAPIEFESY
jgi:hypothetical protein